MDSRMILATFIIVILAICLVVALVKKDSTFFIHQKLDVFMADFSELKAAFEEHKAAVAQERVEVKDKLDSLLQKIDDLEGNLNGGGTVAERSALLADIKTTTQEIKDIIPNTPAPDPNDGDVTDDSDVDADA